VGTNMALIGGRNLGRWKRRKKYTKRERQKTVSEESDIKKKKNAEFATFQFLAAALMKIRVFWGVQDIKAT